MEKYRDLIKYIMGQFGKKDSLNDDGFHYSYCMFPEKDCECNYLKNMNEHTSLIMGGYIDSFSMLVVLLYLEEKYNLIIPDKDAIPENFDTVKKMMDLIDKLKSK